MLIDVDGGIWTVDGTSGKVMRNKLLEHDLSQRQVMFKQLNDY